MSHEFFAQVDALTEAGQLRRLSGAFARFIASVGDSSPQLMAACVLLSELEGRGHSCLMLDELNADPAALLGWSGDEWRELRASVGDWPESTAAWRTLLLDCQQVWAAHSADDHQPLVLDGERLYLRRYWQDETHVAKAVRGRALGGVLPLDDEAQTADIRRWLDILFPHAARGGGPDWQKIACAVAMRGKLGIITGGPGTGKTYTVARLLALLFATAGERQAGLRVALAAPTGKAAARLKQSIDTALDELADKVGGELPLRELAARMGAARTLHSLLGARPDTRAFQHNAGNQLEVDVLIVDEASMIHLEMMSALLAALPETATLILLGDKDQLASVEAGAVLGDLCHNAEAGDYLPETLSYVHASTGQEIPAGFEGHGGPIAQQTVMLRESRRFGGPIGALALAVNSGDAAAAVNVLREGRDARIAWTDLAQSADLLQLALNGRPGAEGGYRQYLQLVKNSPAEVDEIVQLAWVKSVLKAFESFRILCAVREGEWGVAGLNDAIEQKLQSAGLLKRTGEWYVGRPVMVTRNDYATGVFNGDIGLTLPDPARPGALRVYFSEGETVRSVLATRLRNVETAFAMTVHKSQGSEFAHTAMVLPKDGGGMLARELIYTGITRARDYFTLLTPNGQVLLDAIGQRTQRASGLRNLLGQ
ncbi:MULTISPECIES: exodeoxyribonuclease V subunit alpha [unclassified Duganella]|uniref:exodeoxyribonuclease V subunit alpha n=1 Tax=unclassified Duganella TaxID=2636909 RepID=UPI000884CBAE|nr:MULTISPECIES: exodeoxyribonuclease V subunit alpha [unclassified Duganella]SDF67139.1 DNA helicase/exodeoxyribonuclease V, alpha subunit [Duganella sp. OV458]SDI61854.1 DNA helicase/exodeoxyribonuclease V, alpha subunit [Duganella sp. OV510]